MGSCYNSTVVAASADDVWKTIRNFHDLGWGAPVITSLDKVGDAASDQPGAGRVLNGLFHETLISLDDENHTFSYSIDDGPEPVSKSSVSNYVGSVRLCPVTDNGTTFVEWTSKYESADPAAVGEFCNPIYVALLDALKKHYQLK